MLGEYGTSATDVKAEFIWMSAEVANDNTPFGGDDGTGGYAPLAVVEGSTLKWVHGNHLGVPVTMTDAAGTALTLGGDYMLPGFPGQSRTLADLFYNRYRDYDPTTGRYIQADPIGLAGGANPYVYAENNPLSFIDPEGLDAACFYTREGCSTNPSNVVPNLMRLRDVVVDFFAGDIIQAWNQPTAGNITWAAAACIPIGKIVKVGKYGKRFIPARSSTRRFTSAEREQINEIGRESGCHTCGTTDPGTRTGNFVPDHQPPTSLNPNGAPQRLYPHCLECSRNQGLEIARSRRNGG